MYMKRTEGRGLRRHPSRLARAHLDFRAEIGPGGSALADSAPDG